MRAVPAPGDHPRGVFLLLRPAFVYYDPVSRAKKAPRASGRRAVRGALIKRDQNSTISVFSMAAVISASSSR